MQQGHLSSVALLETKQSGHSHAARSLVVAGAAGATDVVGADEVVIAVVDVAKANGVAFRVAGVLTYGVGTFAVVPGVGVTSLAVDAVDSNFGGFLNRLVVELAVAVTEEDDTPNPNLTPDAAAGTKDARLETSCRCGAAVVEGTEVLLPGRGTPQAPHFEADAGQLQKHSWQSQLPPETVTAIVGAGSTSFAVFGDESFELWLDDLSALEMVSAEVCGRDSFGSSITSVPESSLSSELPSDVCFSTDSLLSLSSPLDSDEDRVEFLMLVVLAVPTAATTSFGALNEKERLSRKPRLGADSGANARGFGSDKIDAGNEG